LILEEIKGIAIERSPQISRFDFPAVLNILAG
jgi:hypothetical protein